MKDETHKRMAGDYEIIQSIHIGDREKSHRMKALRNICVPSASRMSCLRHTVKRCV